MKSAGGCARAVFEGPVELATEGIVESCRRALTLNITVFLEDQ